MIDDLDLTDVLGIKYAVEDVARLGSASSEGKEGEKKYDLVVAGYLLNYAKSTDEVTFPHARAVTGHR